MQSILLASWAKYLQDWTRAKRSIKAEIDIRGRVVGRTEDIHIATARDGYGTVLHLNPDDAATEAASRSVPLAPSVDPKKTEEERRKVDAKRQKENSESRKWRQTWAKIAVRAGYLAPEIDPVALATLLTHRRRSSRVELILDTNSLIGGFGHWLLRLLGDRADLVRTAVTDLEIQQFGQMLREKGTYDKRFNFNAACRFLETVPHSHPVWRHLDAEEETSLFVAKSSDSEKSPGADALMLRAVRRSIQEMVPGLRRFFVTSDQTLARAASHELPAGSAIVGYVNPIPTAGVHLAPLTWWPERDQGVGSVSNLADFVWEALCLCEEITLRRSDGALVRVAAYVPERNQYPSSWARPLLWVDHGVGAAALSVSVPVAGTPSADGTLLADPSDEWPLTEESLPSSPVDGSCETAKNKILDAIYIAYRALDGHADVPVGEMPRDVQRLLIAMQVVNEDGGRGAMADTLLRAFRKRSGDLLSSLLANFSPYNALIQALRVQRAIAMEDANALLRRSVSPVTGLARYLGQVVKDESVLRYGGGAPGKAAFGLWLIEKVDMLSAESRMNEASLAALAAAALQDLFLSPERFAQALQVSLRDPLFGLVPSAGGTPQRHLSETIARLSPDGVTYELVSADGLLGYRTLRRRKST